MTLWVNGLLVDAEAPVVRADDHGLVVGDGVFETLEVRDGVAFALSRHLRRLADSAVGLGMKLDDGLILEGVAATLADRPARARLRITVTGGPSPYGSARGEATPTVLVATGPLPTWPQTDDVVVVPWTRNERAATAGLKTTSYADNVVALGRAHEHGGAEALFLNTRNEICEGTGSNIFYVVDGILTTPPLSSGCLAGITRELLIEWLRADGVEVREVAQPVEALRRASEAFLTSSTRRVQAIGALDAAQNDRVQHDKVRYDAAPGPVTQRAIEVFDRNAAADLDP